MIRFIDLRGQDTDGRFAFYDTVYSSFIEISGDQVWNTWQEFRDGYASAGGHLPPLERFEGLAPAWTRIPELDDAHCMVCELLYADHTGECMTRSELVTWLAGEP